MGTIHFLTRSRSPLLLLAALNLVLCIASAAATVTVAAPVSTSTEYTDFTRFKDAILNSTNTYRAQHNATNLKWNDTLADYGQNWGNKCVFKHSGGRYGENLASGYPNATASIEAWGNERDHYNYKAAQFSEQTGHFTQLVWKATTTVGCSRTNCTDKGDGTAPGWFVVCEYYPPGNVIGEFKQNVQSEVSGSGGGNGCPQGADCSLAGLGKVQLLEKAWRSVALAISVGWWVL